MSQRLLVNTRKRFNALKLRVERLEANRGYRTPFPKGDPREARFIRRFFVDSPVSEVIWAEYELQRIMLGIDPELEDFFRSSFNPGFNRIVVESGARDLYKSHERGGWVFRLYMLMFFAPEDVAVEAADVIRQIQLYAYSDELPELELGEKLSEFLKKRPNVLTGLTDSPEPDLTRHKIIPSPPGIIPLDIFAKQSLSKERVISHAQFPHLWPDSFSEHFRRFPIVRQDPKVRSQEDRRWDRILDENMPSGWP